MAKRKPLAFDSEELTNDLEKSTGQGVNALFDSPKPSKPVDKDIAVVENEDKTVFTIPSSDKEDLDRQESVDIVPPSNHDAMPPRYRDTVVSRNHETIIEVVRKAVKQFGKEAATHRFTLEEKKAIADIIYAYKNRDLKTSENEITRIAVNFILQDYQENGEGSILDRVLAALHA